MHPAAMTGAISALSASKQDACHNLEIANVDVNADEEDRAGGGDPEYWHITHTTMSYVDNTNHIHPIEPNRKGRRARPIAIPNTNGEDAPLELHKTREEPSTEHNITEPHRGQLRQEVSNAKFSGSLYTPTRVPSALLDRRHQVRHRTRCSSPDYHDNRPFTNQT